MVAAAAVAVVVVVMMITTSMVMKWWYCWQWPSYVSIYSVVFFINSFRSVLFYTDCTLLLYLCGLMLVYAFAITHHLYILQP